MHRGSRNESWGIAHLAMVVFALVALASMVGCAAENSGGTGGTGGVSNAVGDNVVDVPADVIHDPRWDPPEGLAQAVVPVSNATACTSGTQCPTGNCVDGFCCDAKCDNKCI
jgi:hypothetical protein